MATLGSIRAAVVKTLQDPGIATAEIDEKINEGYADVSGRVLLPALETSAILATLINDTEVTLPTAFERNLFFCSAGGDYPDIKVLSSSTLMMQRYPNAGIDNTDGEVQHVCRSGGSLLYHPVPEEGRDLLLRFYTAVTNLATPTAIPVAIPTIMQKPLLHAYACKELYTDIEDDISGEKVNTLKFEGRYKKALAELQDMVKQGQARPVPARTGTKGWA